MEAARQGLSCRQDASRNFECSAEWSRIPGGAATAAGEEATIPPPSIGGGATLGPRGRAPPPPLAPHRVQPPRQQLPVVGQPGRQVSQQRQRLPRVQVLGSFSHHCTSCLRRHKRVQQQLLHSSRARRHLTRQSHIYRRPQARILACFAPSPSLPTPAVASAERPSVHDLRADPALQSQHSQCMHFSVQPAGRHRGAGRVHRARLHRGHGGRDGRAAGRGR